MFLQEVLLFKPLLQFVLGLKSRAHLAWLVEPSRCLFVKFDPIFNLCVDFSQLSELGLNFTLFFGLTFVDGHLQHLLSDCDLPLKVNLDVGKVQASIVAKLYPVKGLLVQELLHFISILLEFRGLHKLSLDLVDEL